MKEKKRVKFDITNNRQQHFSNKFAKLLDPDSSWDKDQLGDVLHWIRQVVALICGLIWGAIPLVGGIWIGIFLLLSSGIIYGYYAMILKIDEEDFGGHGALLQEGLFVSIMLFLPGAFLVYFELPIQPIPNDRKTKKRKRSIPSSQFSCSTP